MHQRTTRRRIAPSTRVVVAVLLLYCCCCCFSFQQETAHAFSSSSSSSRLPFATTTAAVASKNYQRTTKFGSSVLFLSSSSSPDDDSSDDVDTTESAAARYSGTDAVMTTATNTDMNQYNLLDLETIAQEWTAVLVAATSLQEEGISLRASNDKEIMVDTLKINIKRKPNQGLGIELLELAGGRDDGLGITVVSGLVEGGCAQESGLLPGDSISQVALVQTTSVTTTDATTAVALEEERQEVMAIATECLGYDRTVEAIGSLPAAADDDDNKKHESMVVLTVKRLRRKPRVQVKFQYPPDQQEEDISIELFAGENLRRAMLVRGVKLNDPLAKRFDSGGSGDCGAEGTCATCAVSIVRGEELLSPKGIMEEQIFRDNPRWRLACKTIIGYGMKEGEMVVRVSPRQW